MLAIGNLKSLKFLKFHEDIDDKSSLSFLRILIELWKKMYS